MNNIRFYIRSSHSLKALADDLINVMHSQQQPVFQPFYIVTQTDGMNNWLKQQIAESTGIAANLNFFKPNELINKIYFATGGEFQNTLSRSDLSWLLYDLFSNNDIIQAFPAMTAYYHEKKTINDVKRIALAEVVADLFDQYQVYRPEMLEQWSQNKLTTDFEDEKWQKEIWFRLKEKAGAEFPDKNRIKKSIVENLNDPANIEALKERIPGIYFFGTSLITAYHLEILIKVSAHIPVYIFLPNPAPDIYWYEDESLKSLFYKRKKGINISNDDAISNPLLVNWGKLIQNTFLLLFKNDEIINQHETVSTELPKANSLLEKIQKYIFENSVPAKADFFSNKMLEDGTISIQSCYSPAREVETLYNYLIELIHTNEGKYAERDIVVQVTDINKYASYIRAVFDHAPYPLNYTIADESFTASDSLSKAFYELLKMDENNFTSESVMQLLDFDTIRKHFQITNVDLIRRVVNDANIRHGIEGDIKNDSIYVSWKYGLNRIMYGICVSGEKEFGNGKDSFFPLDAVEGDNAWEVIRFGYFVNKVIDLVKLREQDRTVNEWSAYLKEVLSQLIFDREENVTDEYNYLVKEIDQLLEIENIFEENISYSVFLKHFLPKLNENVRSYRFARGGITFCSLIPMRSIPFKIVAMLGLDFDKFPRKPVKTGFDLMSKAPKLGDRNIKINDKHLFLETVLSAGDHLYMSYTGQRINDNSSRPPSILVDELVSFIESVSENPKDVKSKLITKQPLHSFSNRYQQEDNLVSHLFSSSAKDKHIFKDTSAEPIVFEQINLREFYSFFKDPVKYYYNKVLGIYFDINGNTLPESEMFEMDSLQSWQLKSDLLWMEKSDLGNFISGEMKKGSIPLGNVGTLNVLNADESIKELRDLFEEARGTNEKSSQHVEVEIDGTALSGNIENVYGEKILHICISKYPNKYLFDAYLSALLVSASSLPHEVLFLADDILTAQKIPEIEAKKHLKELIDLYKKGFEEILPFNSSWASTPEELNSLKENKWRDNLIKYADDYTKRELEFGVFSQKSAFEEYGKMASGIVSNLAIVFPNLNK